MISVDTSVWVAFLQGRPVAHPLVKLLEKGVVEAHRLVHAELALGGLGADREVFLQRLGRLVLREPEDHAVVLEFIGGRHLWGKGLGYVDAHVLCSAAVAGNVVWSLEKEVQRAAVTVGVAYSTAR